MHQTVHPKPRAASTPSLENVARAQTGLGAAFTRLVQLLKLDPQHERELVQLISGPSPIKEDK